MNLVCIFSYLYFVFLLFFPSILHSQFKSIFSWVLHFDNTILHIFCAWWEIKIFFNLKSSFLHHSASRTMLYHSMRTRLIKRTLTFFYFSFRHLRIHFVPKKGLTLFLFTKLATNTVCVISKWKKKNEKCRVKKSTCRN